MFQRKVLHLLPVATGAATHIKVEVFYTKGGMNYFSGNNERRGLYLSITPVSRTEHENFGVSESYTAFSGAKVYVKELERYSAKTLREFVVEDKQYNDLLMHVLTTNNITLK